MVEEKRDARDGDPFKRLLKEALVQQRNSMLEIFFQILRKLPMTTATSSINNHFEGVMPFKVHVNFDISLFESQIDAYALEKWLNMLEGYYCVQKKIYSENITFALLKSLPHIMSWWEGYWERYTKDESTSFRREPTWEAFVDSLKEELYHFENYDDHYMRWMTLHQERDHLVLEYTNIFHTLCSKLGIRDFE